MSEKIIIDVKHLVKKYGETTALRDLSFSVKKGDVFGLLGPNGAGKTTTVKILIGLLKPTDGFVRVFDYDPSETPIEVKKRIGYVPEEVTLYESLTVKEFLDFVVSVRGCDKSVERRINALLSAFDIREYYELPISSLSQGTKQKVAIIAAMIHKPPLLILDEPLKGLDARTAKILKELLHLHVKNGGTILFSTHIMEIAESICTRIGIIYNGEIVAEGSVSELRTMIKDAGASLEEIFLRVTKQEEEVEEAIKEIQEAFGG